MVSVRSLVAVALALIVLGIGPSRLQGASACSPASGEACQPLAEDVLELPPSPAVLGHARITLQPGATYPEIVVPGPALLVVTSGVASIQIPGETEEEGALEEMARQAVWRQSAATPIPEELRLVVPQLGTFEFTLGVGDQFTARADTPHSILNRADVPLTLVALTVTPPEPSIGGPDWPPAGAGAEHPPDGVELIALDVGYQTGIILPGPRARVSIDAIDLPVGSAGPTLEPSLGLFAVESGTVAITCSMESSIRDGESDHAMPTAAAQPVELHGNGALLVADASTCAWSVSGNTPATVIVIILSVQGDLGTPEPHDH